MSNRKTPIFMLVLFSNAAFGSGVSAIHGLDVGLQLFVLLTLAAYVVFFVAESCESMCKWLRKFSKRRNTY